MAPNLLGSRDWFHGGRFFHRPVGGGGWFYMLPGSCTCADGTLLTCTPGSWWTVAWCQSTVQDPVLQDAQPFILKSTCEISA